jgi:SSS family solute:Na+ symporter
MHHGLTAPVGAESLFKGGWIGQVLHTYPSEMAQNFWTAIWSWSTCFLVTVLISVLTARTKSDDDLRGLVYSLTERHHEGHLPWYKRPVYLGVMILVAVTLLNLAFL